MRVEEFFEQVEKTISLDNLSYRALLGTRQNLTLRAPRSPAKIKAGAAVSAPAFEIGSSRNRESL